jgi:peptidoglycan/xylan/chitin deacetylase (PgdA/CDA1 family)
MKPLTALAVLLLVRFTVALLQNVVRTAADCEDRYCKAPRCRCTSTNVPGYLSPAETPQFVVLTFDDAVTVSNIEYYRDATKQYTRSNPDGCPSAMTFFVSHEYTDYSLVHELHANGHEIALHSITHKTNITFWAQASISQLRQELTDERALISKFANINAADIKGIRMPFLQMAGDAQFEMLREDGFLYDLSWPTLRQTSPGYWPYTLDYASTQDCVIGRCPKDSHPGVWVTQ